MAWTDAKPNAPAVLRDQEAAGILHQGVAELGNWLPTVLTTPLGKARTQALHDMIDCTYGTGKAKALVFQWPRRGTPDGDCCKTTTIQLFLFLHVACGITHKSLRVQCLSGRASGALLSELATWIDECKTTQGRILTRNSELLEFVASADQVATPMRRATRQDLGCIVVGPYVSEGVKGVKTHVLIFDDVAKFHPTDVAFIMQPPVPAVFFFYTPSPG